MKLPSEIHRPTRTQALVFFFFTLAVAGFVIMWVFFINKGTLEVTGPTPFTIKAGGASETCENSPCTLTLTPRDYTVSLQKEDYYNESQEVTIERSETMSIKANFAFIPVLHEIGELKLPLENAPLRPPFLGAEKLPNFPHDVSAAWFSASGNKILIKLGREIYLYDVNEQTVSKTTLSPLQTFGWLGESIIVLTNVEGGGVNLERSTFDTKQSETLVSFKRQFSQPQLFGSPTGKYVVITDIEDGASTPAPYLVDITKKSRKRLEIPPTSRGFHWADDYLIFENENVFAFEASSFKQIELPALAGSNVLTQNGKFIFATAQKLDSERGPLGVSITEALEEAKKETFEPEKITPVVYITEYDYATKTSTTLVEVPIAENERIERLTSDPRAEKIYFGKGGRVFEIQFKP